MDLADPRQWNAYVYSNNSPITFSDPTGLYCDSCDFYNYKENGYVSSPQSIGCGYSPNGMCGPEGSGYSSRSSNSSGSSSGSGRSAPATARTSRSSTAIDSPPPRR